MAEVEETSSRSIGAEIIGVDAQDRDLNAKAMRMCQIRLDPQWKSWIEDPRKQQQRYLRLQWNPGVIPGGRWPGVQRRVLKPGDTTIIDIGRAQAWFGLFTVPTDVLDVIDEKKAEEMWRNYTLEKARTILTWGDFQKGALEEDKDTTFGPARLPDVYLTVIEADGERWPEIRLRELYELGDYQEVDIPRSRSRFFQQQQLPAAPAAAPASDARIAALENVIAEQRGLLQGLMAALQHGPTAANTAPTPATEGADDNDKKPKTEKPKAHREPE